MRAPCLLDARVLSTLAALALAACGAPANNSALFTTSSATTTLAGAGAGGEPAVGGSNTVTGGSSGSTGAGGGGGMHAGGGAGGAPNGGAPNGGTPNGGASGSAAGGVTNGGGGTGGAGLSNCASLPSGAKYDPDTEHCYLAVHAMVTFDMARANCMSMGAHLVTLANSAENAFVWGLDNSEHWIGASDGKGPKEAGPGTYTWVDGEPFTYTDWSPGQPNATPSDCPQGGGSCYEHCAFQWSGGNAPGEWNDRLCAHTISFVCEWDG